LIIFVKWIGTAAFLEGFPLSWQEGICANPGKEGFYSKLGFKKMNTAMAIFQDEEAMLQNGTISE